MCWELWSVYEEKKTRPIAKRCTDSCLRMYPPRNLEWGIIQWFKRNGGGTRNVTLSVGTVTIYSRYIDAIRMFSPPFPSKVLNNNLVHISKLVRS